jgi:hypothetical protein
VVSVPVAVPVAVVPVAVASVALVAAVPVAPVARAAVVLVAAVVLAVVRVVVPAAVRVPSARVGVVVIAMNFSRSMLRATPLVKLRFLRVKSLSSAHQLRRTLVRR